MPNIGRSQPVVTNAAAAETLQEGRIAVNRCAVNKRLLCGLNSYQKNPWGHLEFICYREPILRTQTLKENMP